MATLVVPPEQVSAVLGERISAGEDLLTKAAIAEKGSGHGDRIYLFEKWREHTIAELRAMYEGDDVPFEFEFLTRTSEGSTPRTTFPKSKSSLEQGLATLRDLIERLPLAVAQEELRIRPWVADKAPVQQRLRRSSIFIVHGRTAGGFLDGVARFVEQVGLTPVILAEQASEGRTVIEKFEAKALDVGYAIALLTPEDSAFVLGEEPPPRPNRARQNVILELGYFMASLGRRNVVALKQEGVEIPTDILGIVYIPLDDAGAWRTLLARELQAAGYELDLRGLLG